MAHSGALFSDSEETSLPVSSEMIGTLNGTPKSVLKNSHVSLLKRLAKSASDVILHVRISDGTVRKISHTIEDFSSLDEVDDK